MVPIILTGSLLSLFLLLHSHAHRKDAKEPKFYLREWISFSLLTHLVVCKHWTFKKNENQVTRLSVVKDVVAEFVKNREMDRIGMVVFGANAFTQCPLTLDQNILLSFLDKLKIGMAGDATAIGSAIGISARRLKDLKSKSKIIILLTDGRNNSGTISTSAGCGNC